MNPTLRLKPIRSRSTEVDSNKPACPGLFHVIFRFVGASLFAGVLIASAVDQPLVSPRSTFNFNPDWKLFVGDPAAAATNGFDDSRWKNVTLPHAWNEDSAFKVSIADLPTGIAWYRKHFRLPADAAGKKVFLEFEGVRQSGEFYLNGKQIGRHENGVMAVGFDITDAVLPAPQENVLAVRTDNSWDYSEKATGQRFQWNDRNFNANYGGIPKNVKLHVTGRLYQTLPLYSNLRTTGVYIYARDFDIRGKSAIVTAESEVRNEYDSPKTFTYEVTVETLDGKRIKHFSSSPVTVGAGQTVNARAATRVEPLEFWSWGYGYLYNVITTLTVDGRATDSVCTRTGFRKTEFGHGLIKLNDRVVQMKGYAQRTSNEWPAMGMSVPPWLSDLSNALIVEGNGNLIRWMHVTPWKQDVESCDRVGLIQSMPAGDSESDVIGRRWRQRLDLMRDAMIYNRNNPSILFYESGNKGVSEEHMAEMKSLRDEYDPYGGRASGSREMLGSEVAEYGGEMLYINKSARLPFWAMEYCRDEGLRKYWDEFSPPFHKDGNGPLYRNAPAGEYNRNQDSLAVEDVARWFDYWRERPGTGTRVSSGGVNIIFSDSNTHYRGAENYRRSGEVDAMRIPKDAFWAHQVMWDGWVDVEHPRIHIIGHWNYAPGTKKNVYVVSSADRVQLFINGKVLNEGLRTNQFLFTFPNVVWQPGSIRAVGLDASGAKLCETEMHTASEPAAVKLSLTTGPSGLLADGADVALVQVEVVDAAGRRCPTALNNIDFDLTGPAEWRGGIAQGRSDNFILSKSLPVECGVNRVLVRSTREAGAIKLTASSAGLKSAALELKSKPITVKDGLATLFPSDPLRPSLKRGPTPAGPSFQVTRITVPIASADAGTNVDEVRYSFDDNEETSWSNDRRLGTAWVRYEFAREARPTEVVIKLTGWRQRSYPLRITVDGEEVYRGATPRSLGYVTLPLKPVTGKNLKIELIKSAETREGFNITELEPQSGGSNNPNDEPSGTLSIVEFECYEVPKRESTTALRE
jgi:beta-galactosidase